MTILFVRFVKLVIKPFKYGLYCPKVIMGINVSVRGLLLFFPFFFANNLNISKICHNRDTWEMSPFNCSYFIFILFNNLEHVTMIPYTSYLRKNQSRKFSIKCYGLSRIRLINYLMANHHILLQFLTLLKAQYKLGFEIKHPVLQGSLLFHNNNSIERKCSHFLTGLRLWNVTASLQ